MAKEKIEEVEKRVLFNTYARYPLEIVRGEGIWLYDFYGKRYCDFLSGISVCNLGHCNPEINEVIKEQISKLIHVSNLFYQRPQLELAESLLRTSNMDLVFFSNSGAEANEAAIKLTRRYMQKIRKENRYKIITLEGSFHGRTLATLAATGQEKIKEGFSPLPPGFVHIPINDKESLNKFVDKDTSAIMIEIIQGEGGVRPLDIDFLKEIQRICKEKEILFIIDEIQTGLGRTGYFWSYQFANLDPDIVTSAKALANGLPIGAMMAKKFLKEAFPPGSHGSTFGGGPLVCSVATKVIEIIKRDKLHEKAKSLGNNLIKKLKELKEEFSEKIKEVRGRGLMIGIEFNNANVTKLVWEKLLENGFICNITQQKVIRLLPPLIVKQEHINMFIDALTSILKSLKVSKN